jgi:CubicO group peptidase (beta-lactamase class C family)
MVISEAAKHGLSAKRMRRLNTVMQRKYINTGRVVGVHVSVMRRGQLAYNTGLGLRTADGRQVFGDDTICRMGALTRPVTIAAVMMLYEQNLFHLDDPVADYIPAYKNAQVYQGGMYEEITLMDPEYPLTIRHLLTQTAGISYGHNDQHPTAYLYSWADLFRNQRTLAEEIEVLAKIPLRNQPGTRFVEGFCPDVLAHLVEVLSGVAFPDYLATEIFEPLGMTDTAFYVPPEKQDRLAGIYWKNPDGQLETFVDPHFVLATDEPPKAPFASGGLYSTAQDYTRFCAVLLNGGDAQTEPLLGRKTVEWMLTNHLPPDLQPQPGLGYGMGFNVITSAAHMTALGSVGECSVAGAYSTHVWLDPAEAMVTLLMVQTPLNQTTIGQDVKTLVYQALVD